MGSTDSKYFTLCSPPECLSNNLLLWHTGSFAASKPKLQTKAVKKEKIFMFANEKYIYIYIFIYALVQRVMGKLIEYDDNIQKFYLQTYYRKMEYHDCLLLWMLRKLKCSRFNSKYLHQSIKVEDVFSQYWLNEAF